MGQRKWVIYGPKKGVIYGPKKMSQLWAEMGMGFREYRKCQKKGVAIYEPKKMSQLWPEMGMGFREYLKCQKKCGQLGLSSFHFFFFFFLFFFFFFFLWVRYNPNLFFFFMCRGRWLRRRGLVWQQTNGKNGLGGTILAMKAPIRWSFFPLFFGSFD
jgi:hypothetical protein